MPEFKDQTEVITDPLKLYGLVQITGHLQYNYNEASEMRWYKNFLDIYEDVISNVATRDTIMQEAGLFSIAK